MSTRALAADVDQVLDHHRLVREAGRRIAAPNGAAAERFDHLPRRDLGDDDVAHAREPWSDAQKHAAQADEVAGTKKSITCRPPSGTSLYAHAEPSCRMYVW